MPSIRQLFLTVGNNMTDLTGLSEQSSLEVLDVNGNANITSLAGLPYLPNLLTLSLRDFSGPLTLNGLSIQQHLRSLSIPNCGLASLAGAGHLPGLGSLARLTIYGDARNFSNGPCETYPR